MLIASAFPIDDGKNKAPQSPGTALEDVSSNDRERRTRNVRRGPRARHHGLSRPDTLKPLGRDACVTSGHGRIPVPEIVLQHAEIDVLVGQRVAAAVPQHVGPNLGEPGTDAGGRRCD